MTVTNIQAFLQKAEKENEEVKIERLGASIVIKALSEAENDNIKKISTKTRRSKGGNIVKDLDTDLYGDNLVSRCVVSPDLNNAELQAFHGTEGDAAATLKAFLLAGEYADVTAKVLSLNGFDESEEDYKDEVKK